MSDDMWNLSIDQMDEVQAILSMYDTLETCLRTTEPHLRLLGGCLFSGWGPGEESLMNYAEYLQRASSGLAFPTLEERAFARRTEPKLLQYRYTLNRYRRLSYDQRNLAAEVVDLLLAWPAHLSAFIDEMRATYD